MASNLKMSFASANNAANALATLASGGFVDIFATSQPSTPETAAGGTALATLQLGAPAFGSSVNGVITANAIASPTIVNSGTALWFRVTQSDHTTPLWDGSCAVAVTGTWAATTAYSLGAKYSNGVNAYIVTTAGTSAGSGGPTGTGTGITDGSVVWSYLGPINGDMNIGSVALSAGASLSVTSFTFTVPGI